MSPKWQQSLPESLALLTLATGLDCGTTWGNFTLIFKPI
jgi:hypothetical protein